MKCGVIAHLYKKRPTAPPPLVWAGCRLACYVTNFLIKIYVILH